MADQRTRDALNHVTDQMERLRAAILEGEALETEEAFDDLVEAVNGLKIALGLGPINAAQPGPETA